MSRPRSILILPLLASLTMAADQPPTQHRLLNALDTPTAAGFGGWQVDGFTSRLATGGAKVGASAVTISAQAKQAGAKVDLTVSEVRLEGCRRLSLWVRGDADSNVSAVGFQVVDAKGEWLMWTTPLSGEAWTALDAETNGSGWKPAYPQNNHNGIIDLPITGVHVVWFSKAAGATSLTIDGLSARVPASGDGVVLMLPSDEMREPGQAYAGTVMAENQAAAPASVSATWTIQANPLYLDPPLPDAVLGFDHAQGAKTTLQVDGAARGDALFCDGDDTSGYQTPWGAVREAVATIDLGLVRHISSVRWRAGDANWIFQVDVASSSDGSTWTPVAGAQGVMLKGHWGGPHALPWPTPVAARHLRLRFHHGGAPVENLRLPVTIQVYDGSGNDQMAIPTLGPVLARGSAKAAIPARDFAAITLQGGEALTPGAYLLGLDLTIGTRHEVRWSHLFVAPTDEVPAERARRFGINAAQPELAASMRRCGFGWVRFENAKWMMFMPSAGHAAFDGSVAPWHVNQDGIYATYRQNELKVLPYVFQPPEWATAAPAEVKQNRSGYPPKKPSDYGEAVFQLVARFGSRQVAAAQLLTADKKSGLGLLHAVELWNEPNLNAASWGPFVGPIGEYFDVLRAGIEGSRRADPTLPVSAAGWAGIDLEVVGQLAEHRYADGKTPLDLIDIINVHFYSGREEPEICGWDPNVDRDGPTDRGDTYPEQLAALVAWRDLHKPGAEIWLSEIGNDVGGPLGRSERHQAAKLPRGIMLALAAGIERVFIYREKGSDPAQHAGAGLLRNDGSRRPAWLTTATLIRQLQGFQGRALRLPHPDPQVWAYLWQDGGRRVVSAWTLGEAAALGLELGAASVCDAFGRITPAAASAQVMIGYAPTYLTVATETPALTRLITEARERDRRVNVQRQQRDRLSVRAFDFGSAAHVGMLKGFGLPRRFTPVGKDRLWNDADGFGFTQAGSHEEDAHWIADALERDGVRVSKDCVFRVRLPDGRQRVRLSLTPLGEGSVTATLTSATGTVRTPAMTANDHVFETTLIGGGEPLGVAVEGGGVLRWLTVTPLDP